jgi:hypothetical protein
MLEQQHAGAWVTAPLDRPLGRGVNFQVEVPSVDGCVAALRDAGFGLFREPSEAWYVVAPDLEEGQLEVLATDPDGYLLRFVETLGSRPRLGGA